MKPLLLSLLSIFIIFYALHAKTSNAITDSLKSLLLHAGDSSRVELLLELSNHVLRNNPQQAIDYLDEALNISIGIKDSLLMSKSYSQLGVYYKNKGDYPKALTYHFKSKEINEHLGHRPALASNYNDIGIIYKTMREYDNALEYYRRSNAICIDLGMTRGIVMTLNNIGTIYEAQGQSDEAIIYYQQAYENAVEFNILGGQAITLNNLGDIYAAIGDSYKARQHFKQAAAIDFKTGDMFGHLYSLLNVAATFIGTSEYDSSLHYYQKAENLAHELGSAQHMIHVYAGKTRLFQQQEDYKTAFEQLQLFKHYQDSVYNETRAQQLAEAEKRYEADKKDREIRMLRQEQMIKDLELDQHRAERTALISAMILIAFILIYLYNRHRQRQKAELNKQMIRQKELYLKAIVETQEQERKRIAKDLHDGVGQTLSGVKLNMDNILKQVEQIPEDEAIRLKELVNHIDEACLEVRSISHQMMPRVLQEDGLIPAMQDMLEKSFRHSSITYNFEHHGLNGRLDENIEIGLYRICQELVNNVIKHSGASDVQVQLMRKSGLVLLLVEDNGKGFINESLREKGIGLMNINSRVETINGEFNIEPSPLSGTLATIRIPIKQT